MALEAPRGQVFENVFSALPGGGGGGEHLGVRDGILFCIFTLGRSYWWRGLVSRDELDDVPRTKPSDLMY